MKIKVVTLTVGEANFVIETLEEAKLMGDPFDGSPDADLLDAIEIVRKARDNAEEIDVGE